MTRRTFTQTVAAFVAASVAPISALAGRLSTSPKRSSRSHSCEVCGSWEVVWSFRRYRDVTTYATSGWRSMTPEVVYRCEEHLMGHGAHEQIRTLRWGHYVAGLADLPTETPCVYVDGADWTNRVSEVDLRGQWVVAFGVASHEPFTLDGTQRRYFGKVELRSA